MGSFSPVRVATDSPNPTAGPPFKLVPNQYSLLDKTDLVFIDAPLTGFSRAVGKATAKDFTGVDQDLRAFDRFILRYLTVNQRWNSPKFLIGESYGTTRSAALADMLGNDGVQLNGVVLISSILNYNIRAGGYDILYVGNLPSYAAAAWYFDKIPNKPANVADWVQQARDFAAGPYAQALFAGRQPARRGTRLRGQGSEPLHRPQRGLHQGSQPAHLAHPLPKEVLRDDRRTLGRYDMRFEGVDLDAAGETPSYDASDTGITGAFVGAFHDYLERELKYESTDAYRPTRLRPHRKWDWKHRPTSGGPGMEAASERAVPALRGRRPGQRHPQESAPEGLLGQRLLRPGHALLRHRVRCVPHGPGAGPARQYPVRLLPLGPHDLSERGCAAPAERRPGGVHLPRRSSRKRQLLAC